MIGIIDPVRLAPRTAPSIAAFLALATAGCASAPPPAETVRKPVRAEDMSAEEHRAAARREEGVSAGLQGTTDPSFPGEVSAPYADRVTGRQDVASETSSGLRVTRARSYTKHASEHLQAAELLETFEAAECTRSPHQERAMCPVLQDVIRVENTRTGVRLILVEGADAEKVVNHMRCHHAFGKTRGFQDMDSCPLYLNQIRIRKTAPGVIELTSGRPSTAVEIQRRSRDHVTEERVPEESPGETP